MGVEYQGDRLFPHPCSGCATKDARIAELEANLRPLDPVYESCHLCGGRSVQGKHLVCETCGVLWKGGGPPDKPWPGFIVPPKIAGRSWRRFWLYTRAYAAALPAYLRFRWRLWRAR